MQKLSDSKAKVVCDSKMKVAEAGGRNASGSLGPKKRPNFFGLLASSESVTHRKNTATVLEAHPGISHSRLPHTNLTAVMHWVALEEKIVHDYQEQEKSSFKTLRPDLPSADPAVMTWVALEEKIIHDYKEQKKKPFLKILPSRSPRIDSTPVMSWVALEEKIIHDYKEREKFLGKSPIPFKNPARQPVRSGRAFTTSVEVSLSSNAKKPRTVQKVFPNSAVFFLALGWIVIWGLVFLHIQGVFSNHGTAKKLSRLQSENKQLGQSYNEVKGISKNQDSEIEWLNKQIRDLSLELKTAKNDKITLERNLENKYREELMQMAVSYELEIDHLRGVLQTQDSIVKALKAQGQAFDKIVEQAGLSALSGAAGFSDVSFATGVSNEQGVVTSVNRRQGSVVISLGSDQGVASKQRVAISRNGRDLASGRIDRVYPTMSVVLIRDASMVPMIRVGDSVSFV